MRKIWVLVLTICLLMTGVAAAQIPAKPPQITFVNDYANILSVSQEQNLVAVLSAIEKATSVEAIVVTVKSLETLTAFDYSQKLFTAWGIGKAATNNGLLILVALDEREYRLHTGYGLEGPLPDGKLGTIGRDYILPSFRQGNYYEGIMIAVVNGIIPALEKEYNRTIDIAAVSMPGQDTGSSTRDYSGLIVLAIILMLLSNKPGRGFLWFMLGNILGRGVSGRGSSGGNFGGGLGGGGGGFGGGRSGGGGAGGRW